jgi:hypothetical protein
MNEGHDMGRVPHLIVVLPGIGGSVLANPDVAGPSAWDVTVGDLRHVLVDPETLRIDRDLLPVRLVDTLTVLGPWWAIPGYDGLSHNLRTWFGPRLTEADVLCVPYDFRRSVAAAADVVGRAVRAAVGDSGRKVVVIAHSMGGLVARYWVGAGGGWRHTHAVVTLGTPHRGAPRALDWLFNGAGVGMLRSPSITRVLRDWPGVYELLPQYPAVLAAGTPVGVDGLSPDLVRPFGAADAGARVLRGFAAAAGVHRDIDAGWAAIPAGSVPTLLPYFGRGHRTLNRAEVRDGRVRVSKEDPGWRGNVGWRGDGTVPAVSAIPAGMASELAETVPDRHGAMGAAATLKEKLITLQGDRLPTRGGLPTMPWVGWDRDEIAAAGQEIAVGVEVQAGAAGPPDVGSAASVVVTGGPQRLTVPMRLDAGQWRTSLPPLSAGTYRLDVEIKDAWHGTSVFADTPLAVVTPPPDGQP